MTEKLKLCPFCGNSKMTADDWQKVNNEYWYECSNCLCESERFCTQQEAMNAWNHRPIEDELVEVVVDLLKEVNALVRQKGINPHDNSNKNHSWYRRIKKARTALKRARGGS